MVFEADFNRTGGIPLIAVPVMPDTAEGIADLILRAKETGADLIEFRADALYRDGSGPDIRALSEKVREAAGEKPVLFTLRTSAEGGFFNGDDAGYGRLVARAAESGAFSCVDIELRRSGAKELLSLAHSRGVKVILSNHSFAGTPSFPEIKGILGEMEEMGADVAKCAYMPVKKSDVFAVTAASAWAKRNLRIPFLVISMGEAGADSRLFGETFGSCMTFGCLPGEASAPGQMEVPVLREKLEELHAKRQRGGFLFLTGFMGTGKSAVASSLKAALKLPVIEMDRQIESREGRPIREIFAASGEEYFRDLETELLAGLFRREPAVVSCGGGVVLREENVALMRALGTTVLLEASPETLYGRLSGRAGNRPNLRGRMSVEGIADLMEKRRPYYERSADIRILTDGRPVRSIRDELSGCVKNGFIIE